MLIYKNMDNNLSRGSQNKEQEMQNWKKQILMDPILNSLFDEDISGQDFLIKKILPLTRSQIASTYSKLTTINFQLTQNMQKEVETKSHFIQKSYLELLDYKQQTGEEAQSPGTKNKPLECLNYLKKFNKKYEKVEESLNLWKNITTVLHYSKGLQAFRVNVNILKALMRGYNGSQQTINPIKVAKMLKQLIQLSTRFDFNSLKAFQSQRVFISNTKSVINAIGNKSLPKLLQQYCAMDDDQGQKKQSVQKSIIEWINALSNLGTLKQFVINLFRTLSAELSDKIKRSIQSNIANLDNNFNTILIPFLIQTSMSLIFLQEKLVILKRVELSNVPNLFIKFWQKMCDSLGEAITLTKKDQQTRNIPKTKEVAIVWKYPVLYDHFAKLCSKVQVLIMENATFNSYSFGKNKERLMVNCLLELATLYQEECNKIFDRVGLILTHNKSTSDSSRENSLQQKKSPEEIVNIYINDIKSLFAQAKTPQIFNSLLKNLTNKLLNISQKIKSMSIQQKKQDIQLLNMLKQKLKLLLKQHGERYGIQMQYLEAFKLQTQI